jgi:hypothetical protein
LPFISFTNSFDSSILIRQVTSMLSFQSHSYSKLEDAAGYIFEMLSEFIGTNTFCLTKTNDQVNSLILHVFNRNHVLFEEGTKVNLDDAY